MGLVAIISRDHVEVDTEEPALDAADSQEGLTADEKEIQDKINESSTKFQSLKLPK